jgi:hypothetical protein
MSQTEKDKRDEVTAENTSAFTSADFLNELDARPTVGTDSTNWAEGLQTNSTLVVVKRGPNAGARFRLDKPVTSAGRHPGSDIFLDDITVSRRHAEFRWHKDGLHIVDMGSLNFTYVNREPVESAPLAHGDEVQIGKFRLVILRPKNDSGPDGSL